VGRSVPPGSVSAAQVELRLVELRLAGTFRVVRDGTELTDGEIGSRKSRTLLKLLAVERPALVPVDRGGRPGGRGGRGPGGRRGGRPAGTVHRGPTLVGRDGEIRSLREAWGRAAAGEPGVVMIVGEAGIGKTALGEFLTAEAAEDGGTVLRTRCYETERSLFLQPVVEAITPVVASTPAAELRQILGEHAAAAAVLLPEAAALLGPPPPTSPYPLTWRGTPDMERRRSFQAVRAFLSGLADRNPVLLIVDDLQYAGQSTIEFIHYLSRHLSGSRLLVVVTVRAEHDPVIGSALASVATRLEVGPLQAAPGQRP